MAFEFEQEIIEPANNINQDTFTEVDAFQQTEESIPFTYIRKVGGDLIKLHFGDHPDVPMLNSPIRNGELRK